MLDIASLGMSAGLVSTSILAVRCLLVVAVVIWSLRADEAGRQHAIRLLESLRLVRFPQRKLTNPDNGPPHPEGGDP